MNLDWLKTPGSLAFWDEICRLLHERHNILVRIPADFGSEIVSRIRNEFQHDATFTSFGYMTSRNEPFDEVNNFSSSEEDRSGFEVRNFMEYAESGRHKGAFICVDFSDTPSDMYEKWCRFAWEHARSAGLYLSHKERPVFFLCATEDMSLEGIREDVSFSVRDYFSYISEVDMEVYALKRLETAFPQKWLQRLAASIVIVVADGNRALVEYLSALQQDQLFDPGYLCSDPFCRSHGLTDSDQVTNLLYMGQARTIFPLLNRIRTRFISLNIEAFRAYNNRNGFTGGEEGWIDNLFNLEFKHLVRCSDSYEGCQFVYALRSFRNKMAHHIFLDWHGENGEHGMSDLIRIFSEIGEMYPDLLS